VEHAEAADELFAILSDAAENIRIQFVPRPGRLARVRKRELGTRHAKGEHPVGEEIN
jgi:hypothetical protein